ncbi:MAG: hypothetical protein M3374_05675 [Pseudomonadota bacterium]|nr:hypothetical protein [Pseudomonadota bacterium]
MEGSALLVAVVFLLLASLFVVFALNVGRFEQRTSGNDVRAKIAHQVAEAGMNQGVEYFNANRGTVIRDETKWEDCLSTDLTFPCGAVSAARRASMQRFVGGSGVGGLQVPLPFVLTQAGGYAAGQQVGAVICRIQRQASGLGTTCTTDIDNASSTWLLTVVAKGALTGEGSSATVTQTIGAYNIFATGTNIPPVIASGSVDVGGGIQIVTAPNAGGIGVPVSVWTRLAMTKNGTPNTCYFDEFLRQGGSSQGPAYLDGITVCHTCNCQGSDSLSFPKSGNQACQSMDIVDIDNNEPNDCPTAPNLDIRRSEFPQDLFAFVFGQRAWDDVDQGTGGDTFANREFNFAETRRISECTYPHPATGASVTATLPEDTCYLLNIKTKVHIGDGINDAAECNAIGIASRGVMWIHGQPILDAASGAQLFPGYDCTNKLKNVDDIGTPNAPVALVFDGQLTGIHFRLYGLVFIRSPNGTTLLDKDTGGDGEFGMNAGATIYGAVIVQGRVTAGGGGTAAIVYNEQVLGALINDPVNESPTSMPGSWTDKLRY